MTAYHRHWAFVKQALVLTSLTAGSLFAPSDSLSNEPSAITDNQPQLTDAAARGPSERGASIAFELANGFIKKEEDLHRFLITPNSVSGDGSVYIVRYKLRTKSEESEAVVRVDIETKTCRRVK